MPAGLAFREGKEGTDFADMNPYLPHRVIKGKSDPSTYQYEYKLNLAQYKIRENIYGARDNSPTLDGIYASNSRVKNTKVGGIDKSGNFVKNDSPNFLSQAASQGEIYQNFYEQNKTSEWYKWPAIEVTKLPMYKSLETTAYSKMDQLGDLETTNPALIKQLRTLKCLPELSGATDVLWGTPN